ncbi:MAG TPA: SDR family oxidoreductase [Kofleriaceae bacterium]|jgi:NADP-dependent 3-hydroxy acid dehydrogenase YdfG|nr:SDR family oxidoreductase [Kofleriaceae bacterium]
MTGILEGKLAVVTGATSGIGAALAHRLSAAGATVIGVGRRREALAAQATQAEGRLLPVCADLADPRGRARAIAEIEARAPRIDLLINNAGEAAYASPLELGTAGWRALFEINVHAAVELSVALAPRIAAGGHLVNVSSVTARFAPNARFAAYAATKGALDRATEALRLELDPRGIHVTSIAPGLVETPLYDKVAGFADTRAKIARQLPRWLTAADVADAIVWVVTRPAHVAIAELVMMPIGQGR